MNNVQIFGRLTRDPELKHTQSGKAYARFTLAVDKGLSKDKKEQMKAQGKPTADFINVVVWGKMAESSANYLTKGKRALVDGSIQTSSYTNDQGQKVYMTDVLARRVDFIDFGNQSNQGQGQGQGNQNQGLPSGFEPVDDDDIPF